MRHPIILTAWLAAVPIVLGSCAAAVVRKDIRNLSSDSSNVTMTLPMAASPFMNGMQDTASIAFPEEDELILAGDSSGIPDVILPLKEIVKSVRENEAIAVGTSALMTSTMVNQKTLEELFAEEGLKGKVITNVGGAPVTQQWADEIGADVYTENATDAVAKMTAAVAKKNS